MLRHADALYSGVRKLARHLLASDHLPARDGDPPNDFCSREAGMITGLRAMLHLVADYTASDAPA